MIIAGTMPIKDLDLTIGNATLKGDKIIVGNKEFPVSMGTGALISAVIKILEYFGEKDVK